MWDKGLQPCEADLPFGCDWDCLRVSGGATEYKGPLYGRTGRTCTKYLHYKGFIINREIGQKKRVKNREKRKIRKERNINLLLASMTNYLQEAFTDTESMQGTIRDRDRQ